MNEITKNREAVHVVRRIFDEYGFGNIALLEGWDGEELEELAEFLTEEEFQTLLDELEQSDEFRT